MIDVGDRVEATFLQPTGEPVNLADLGDGPKLLIFLRHLS